MRSTAPIKVLYLTNSPNLYGTARILQSWLELGPGLGVEGITVVPREGDLARWLASEGFTYMVDPLPWPDRRTPVSSLWRAWRVARWARRSRVDLIHCNEHDVYPIAPILRRMLNRPVVCHVRCRVERPFCEWAFGRKARRPDILLWNSDQMQSDCGDAVKGLIDADTQHVIRLGIDLRSFGRLDATRDETRASWGIRPGEVVVGTASALRPGKRIEEFVRLTERIAAEDPRVIGVIAGDAVPGEEEQRDMLLRNLAASNLGRRLIWLGHLKQVEPFYHAVDIFVSTSEYESFGNSVCEAMACRRPVAAYRGGAVHEVVGDTGRVVGTGDLSGLTAAVRELVNNPGLRAELGERGRRRVAERFNPGKSILQLRGVYESVLSRWRTRAPAS